MVPRYVVDETGIYETKLVPFELKLAMSCPPRKGKDEPGNQSIGPSFPLVSSLTIALFRSIPSILVTLEDGGNLRGQGRSGGSSDQWAFTYLPAVKLSHC